VEDTLAQQVELAAPVHAPLGQLELVDEAFSLPVAVDDRLADTSQAIDVEQPRRGVVGEQGVEAAHLVTTADDERASERHTLLRTISHVGAPARTPSWSQWAGPGRC